MRISSIVTVAVLSTVGGAAPPPDSYPHGQPPVGRSSSAETDGLAAQGARNLARYLKTLGNANATCTKDNIAVRREW